MPAELTDSRRLGAKKTALQNADATARRYAMEFIVCAQERGGGPTRSPMLGISKAYPLRISLYELLRGQAGALETS